MITWDQILNLAKNGNAKPDHRVEKSLVEWKTLLSKEEFQITRLKGTEMPHTGELCSRYDAGKYGCVCCGSELFDSSLKFDSGTGWPSFSEPIKENAIKYEADDSIAGRPRIEVLCNVCDSHLGHVFPDGPPPSGIRFCINSVSMKLICYEKPIIFFDGICGLCNHFIDFIFRIDKENKFNVSPIQGQSAKEKIPKELIKDLSTIIVWHNGKISTKSSAVLFILVEIGGLWSLLALFKIVPKFLRDWIYFGFSKMRYKIFGKFETCRIPSAQEKKKFLP